jgi:hypothetical protein
MHAVASILIGVVAAIHLYIVVLEMAFWQKPLGRKVFRTTPEQAAQTATLAANQGLYNGFLAAGLIWALLAGAAPPAGRHVLPGLRRSRRSFRGGHREPAHPARSNSPCARRSRRPLAGSLTACATFAVDVGESATRIASRSKPRQK